jgi:hypothetical protein
MEPLAQAQRLLGGIYRRSTYLTHPASLRQGLVIFTLRDKVTGVLGLLGRDNETRYRWAFSPLYLPHELKAV